MKKFFVWPLAITALVIGLGVVPAHAVLLDPTLALGASTTSSYTLLFPKQSVEGHDILTYRLEISKDQKTTWVGQDITVQDNPTQRVISLRVSAPAASARYIRVASVDNGAQSNWSNEVVATTKGLRAQRVFIKTYSGAPISGGAVSWTANSGRTHSSTQYGLTSSGYIDFPALPAGSASVTLTGGELPDGTIVSGTFNAFLGFDPVTLTTPNPPMSVRSLTVQLPNGVPVANARVTVDDSYLSSSTTLNGFTFSIPDSSGLAISPDYYSDDWVDPWDVYVGSVVSSGVTDNLGRFTVVGFTNTAPPVSVTYDDGFISQTVTGQLSNYNTTIELDYEPYVDVLASAVLVDAGDAAVVPIQISEDPAAQPAPLSLTAVRPATVGTSISLVRPAGATVGNCGASGSTTLTARQSGTIRICGTKSGVYRVRTGSGILSTGSVTLHVKNAAPMVPRRVKVASTSPGKASLSWSAPEYGGNASVSYRVTAKRGTAVLRSFTTSSRSVSLSGLPHAKGIKFSVVAVNRFGSSDGVVVQTTIA